MTIDLSGQIRSARDAARVKGAEAVKAKRPQEAAEHYDRAANLTLQLADKAISRQVELDLKREALKYRQMAQRLRGGNHGVATVSEGERPPPADISEIGSAVSQMVHAAPVTWDDIGGLDDTKRDIKFSLGVALAQPPEGVRLELWNNMLFYGPPGTGKTLLAAATSRALKSEARGSALFFNVKVSSVMSKYFGESTKILSELYGTARDHSPSVVFLDEFESLTPKRSDEATGPERRLLSTLLAELDGLAEKGKRNAFVLTIAATNRPWDIDAAVLSRFEKKILIPLPDAETRRKILAIHLTGRGFELRDGDATLDTLAARTEGFAGRELERLCKEAVGGMIAEQNDVLPGLVDRGLEAARSHRMRVRPLGMGDFQRPLVVIQPAAKPDDMAHYQAWREEIDV